MDYDSPFISEAQFEKIISIGYPAGNTELALKIILKQDAFKFFRTKGLYHKVEIFYGDDMFFMGLNPTFKYFIDLGVKWRDYEGASGNPYCVESGASYISYEEAEHGCIDDIINIMITRSIL